MRRCRREGVLNFGLYCTKCKQYVAPCFFNTIPPRDFSYPPPVGYQRTAYSWRLGILEPLPPPAPDPLIQRSSESYKTLREYSLQMRKMSRVVDGRQQRRRARLLCGFPQTMLLLKQLPSCSSTTLIDCGKEKGKSSVAFPYPQSHRVRLK